MTRDKEIEDEYFEIRKSYDCNWNDDDGSNRNYSPNLWNFGH